MSNNAPIADELFDQLQRSNRLYALAYTKGYEEGVKYVLTQLEPLIGKLDKLVEGYMPEKDHA